MLDQINIDRGHCELADDGAGIGCDRRFPLLIGSRPCEEDLCSVGANKVFDCIVPITAACGPVQQEEVGREMLTVVVG